jgi:exosome complex component CSL4
LNKDKISIAVPGEKLGVEEEYVPGTGIYVDGGELYSDSYGEVKIDAQSKKIDIRGVNTVAVPEQGDIVEGIVVGIKEDSANIKIVAIKGKKRLSGDFSGVLHVSQIAKSYVNSIFDAINMNDRILAKVITSWPPYQLSTADDDLGVIHSACIRCGEELIQKKGTLFCPREKVFERKKISRGYLLKEA